VPEAYQTYLTQLRADGLRIAARARQPGGLGAEVPDCPGWTVETLVGHLGRIYQYVLTSLSTGDQPVKGRYRETPEPGSDLVDWFDSGHLAVLDRLAGSGPDDPAWTWWPADHTSGFWARRMCHETLVHRMDADGALAFQVDVTPELALDGVDEVLTIFVGRPKRSTTRPTAGQVAVDVQSAGRTWRVVVDERDVTVTPEPVGSPDATAAGTPVDVLRWCWGRPPSRPLHTAGDATALDIVQAVMREASS
jgi:uncharacterized protein (TIGR03083 family)